MTWVWVLSRSFEWNVPPWEIEEKITKEWYDRTNVYLKAKKFAESQRKIMTTVQIIFDGVDNASPTIKKIDDNVKTLSGRSFDKLKGSVVALGAAAGVAAAGGIAALTAGISDSISQAADLEFQMSGVAAVLGKTTEEVAPLNDLVKDLSMSPTLKVNATEAADAIELLARNGVDMTDILDGAAESTVLLANATGAQFAGAADVATDTMALFNIEVSDMQDAVNGITSVVNNSKFGFDDYRLALAQGGGVAATVGVQFDDFNTSIAAMAPLFASGSDAGTSYKTMLQRLVPQTNDAINAMQDLGLASVSMDKLYEVADGLDLSNEQWETFNDQLGDTGNALFALQEATGLNTGEFNDLITKTGILDTAFFDANGNMNDMAEIADALHDSMEGLSDAQKNQALTAIFGADAMRAAAGLANFSEEEFRALQGTMGETDAVENAMTRVDNFRGAMEIFKSVVQGLQIELGEQLLPVFKDLLTTITPLVLAIGQDLVSAVSFIISALENGATPITAFNEGLRVLGVSLEVRNTIRETADRIIELKDQVIEFVSSGLNFWTTNIQPFLASNLEWQDVIIGLSAVIAAVLIPTIASLVISIGAILLPITAAIAAVALLRTAWQNDWGGIQEKTQIAADFISLGVSTLLTNLAMWWSDNGVVIMETVGAMWDWISERLDIAIEYWTSIMGLFIAAFQGDWFAFGQELRDIWDILWTDITGIFETSKDALIEIWNTLTTDLMGAWEEIDWFEMGANVTQGIIDGVKSKIADAVQAVKDLGSGIRDAYNGFMDINSPSRVMFESGVNTGGGVVEGVLNQVPAAIAAGAELGRGIGQGYSSQSVDNSRTVNVTNNIHTSKFDLGVEIDPSFAGGV